MKSVLINHDSIPITISDILDKQFYFMSNSAKKLGAHKIKPLSQDPKRNYSNNKFHSAVDLAKFYSGLVETHVEASKYENHVLSSIDRAYQKELRIRSKSTTGFKTHHRNSQNGKSPVKLTNKKLAELNPEINGEESKSIIFQEKDQVLDRAKFTQTKTALSKRAVRVPEYSEEVKNKCQEKKNLQNYIAELKRNITEQKKMKTKISLNCNKIMNQRELTYANTCKKSEENYNLSVRIAAQEQACADLSEEIQNTNRKLNQTQNKVNQERELRNKVKKYVEETRIVLRNQERDVAQMKEWVSSVYNNMGNNYQYVNQLKQEKAQLLSDIDTNYMLYK